MESAEGLIEASQQIVHHLVEGLQQVDVFIEETAGNAVLALLVELEKR